MGPALRAVDEFVEDPEALSRELRERPQPWLGVAGFLIAGLSIFLAKALGGRLVLLGASPVSLMVQCIWNLLAGVAMSALCHFVAEAMGGRGRALPLFSLFGLSDLAWTAYLPLTLIWLAVFPEQRWAVGVLAVLIGYGVIWLRARSVSHNYELPFGKAFYAVCLPYAGAALAVMLFFSMALWGVLRQVLKLWV